MGECMDDFAKAVTLIAAVLSCAAFYLSLIVFKRYNQTSPMWALLSIAAGIIAFHRLAALAWSFGLLQATSNDFLAFSSVVFAILSLFIFLAAWETKKVSDSYRLVEIKRLEEIASKFEQAAKNTIEKKKGKG